MDCIFCNIVSGEIPSDNVFEGERVLAFNDIKPSAKVHVLVIPKKHIASVIDLENTDAELMGEMVLVAKQIAKEKNLQGYKLAMNVGREGGQIVDHLHLHLLSPDVAGGHV